MKPMKPIVKKVAFLLLGIAGLFALPSLVITAMTAIAEVSVGDREEIREYTANWGLPVGSPAPAIDAPDQSGARRSLDSLAGERGLLLFLTRSADW